MFLVLVKCEICMNMKRRPYCSFFRYLLEGTEKNYDPISNTQY
jgi:hypothetical protein